MSIFLLSGNEQINTKEKKDYEKWKHIVLGTLLILNRNITPRIKIIKSKITHIADKCTI